jgi:p-hydroxybenzoate 3-monooxygenase
VVDHYQNGVSTGMDKYSEKVLARLWKAQRFSWWMTTMLHTFPESLAYDQRLQDGDLAVLFSLENALKVLAENYSAL